MRITFEVRKPTPDSCNEHVSVSVHCVAPTCGPETRNEPTENEKLESWAQHNWKALVARPAVVVPSW
jgi:hypothetical protein